MKKKYAWTLAEMVIAITVLIVLAGIASTVMKASVQKAKFFVYATFRNIEQANVYLMEKNDDELEQPNKNGKDWYCSNLADIFSLKGDANCKAPASGNDTTTVNMTLANGVALYGLANPWRVAYDNADFKIKDILMDINGSKGPNKIWIDRFHFRVFTGDIYTGLVRFVNCADDSMYDEDGVKHPIKTKHLFCASGDNTNYTLDDTIITYDISKPLQLIYQQWLPIVLLTEVWVFTKERNVRVQVLNCTMNV